MIDKTLVTNSLDLIDKQIAAIRAEINRPDNILVRAGDGLQAALDQGGIVELEPGVTFTGRSFTVSKHGTEIIGNNATVHGQSGPALFFPLGLRGAKVSNLFGTSDWDQSVFKMGNNDSTQTTLDATPNGISLRNVIVPRFRGKRAFEINAGMVSLVNCKSFDVWSSAGSDSQGIWIGNSPGQISIDGGYFEAASENILVGGDGTKIVGATPTNILILNVEVQKLLAWKANSAINEKVKTLVEVKEGSDVLIKNLIGKNCWQAGQDGWAFTFTPRAGGNLKNIWVDNANIDNVAGIVNILGVDEDGIGKGRTQVKFTGGVYRTNKPAMGGRGVFALITSGPEYLEIDQADILHTGNCLVQIGDGDKIDRLKITNSKFNNGTYGIIVNGNMQGSNLLGQVTDLNVSMNTITGAITAFKNRYPNNSYI